MAFNKAQLPYQQIPYTNFDDNPEWLSQLKSALKHHAQFVPKKFENKIYIDFDQDTDAYYDSNDDHEFLIKCARRKTDTLYSIQTDHQNHTYPVISVDIKSFFKKKNKHLEKLLASNSNSSLMVNNQHLQALGSSYRAIILNSNSSFFTSQYPKIFEHKLSVKSIANYAFQLIILIDINHINNSEIGYYAAFPYQNTHPNCPMSIDLEETYLNHQKLDPKLPEFDVDNDIITGINFIYTAVDNTQYNDSTLYLDKKEYKVTCDKLWYQRLIMLHEADNNAGENYLCQLHDFLSTHFKLIYIQKQHRYQLVTDIDNNFWNNAVDYVNNNMDLTMTNFEDNLNQFLLKIQNYDRHDFTSIGVNRNSNARFYFDTVNQLEHYTDTTSDQVDITTKPIKIHVHDNTNFNATQIQPAEKNLSTLFDNLIPYTDHHKIYWIPSQHKFINLVDDTSNSNINGTITNVFDINDY